MTKLSSLISRQGIALLLLVSGLTAQSADLPKARAIGPATMSGRVACVQAWPKDPRIVWVGAATGGLWKSADAGLTFKPVFDDQPVASIGSIAIDPHNPDIVWVGTGEGNPRNSASVGRGMWLTRDGGDTWERLGLEATERIHRIVLHPRRRGVAWVAALGRAWGESTERGVFRTEDWGRTWRRVLYVDPRTGCADLVADPRDPDKMFAAMWDYRRHPWTFRSGGPGSGIFVTRDGGSSWDRLGKDAGLPEGDLGRIGLGIARSNPNVVYALVEAKKNALYRSDDGGLRFRKVNDASNVAPRPFYYADIRVCPNNPDRVYNLHTILEVSTDGGRSFQTLAGWKVHPDHHALWIHPEDGNHMINGNDGGIAITRDRGLSWRFCRRLPLAQFYHLSVDRERPYHVLGGLQDNGSWRGPSQVLENAGIRNFHWQEVCFGDGFATLADPEVPTRGYAMSQQGYVVRWDATTGEKRAIRPIGPEGTDLRFSWNAGIAQCPHDPATIYFGSQFLHRSRDRGESWEIISPDLTTNREEWQRQADSGGLTPDVTGAENFTTILTVAPSALDRKVIWVGTDDGNLQITRDGGASWTNVALNLPGVPRHTWIPHVEASRFDAGTAFVVLDDHRRSNWTPYVYRTRDFGETWESLVTPQIDGYVHVIEQDVVDPDLLFLGTEFGLFWSSNGGGSWKKWESDVPTVAVRALVVQPDTHDLVVGTHGRAAFIIDDVSPLRHLHATSPEASFTLLAPKTTVLWNIAQTRGSRFPADGEYRGDNRSRAAMIDIVVHQQPEGDDQKLEIEIAHADGTVVQRFDARKASEGLHRLRWNLRENVKVEDGERRDRNGMEVLPGRYEIRAVLGEMEQRQTLLIEADPREPWTAEQRAAKHARMLGLAELRGRMTEVRERLDDLAADLKTVKDRMKDREGSDELKQLVEKIEDEHLALERFLRIPAAEDKGIRRVPHLASRMGRLRGALGSSRGPATADQAVWHERLKAEAETFLQRAEAFEAGLVRELDAALKASGMGLLRDR